MMMYEFDISVELIQHIQSFLINRKEAGRSCILSKSWYTAWCTRPILIFNDYDFVRKGYNEDDRVTQFSNFCRRNLDRYKELNRKVDTFSLRLTSVTYRSCLTNQLADDLITDALTLGVNELNLTIFSGSRYDLSCKVFAATSLTKLHLAGFRLIDGSALCTRLTSLTLYSVHVTDQIVRDFFLGCPFIEYLSITNCVGLRDVNVSNLKKLVKFTLDCVYLEFRHTNIGMNVNQFCYLRHLRLREVRIEFFTQFSSRFPCVEDLILDGLRGCEDIKISSYSLRYLSLRDMVAFKKMQFNLPNISKFVFWAVGHIPSLSFGTMAPRDWESQVQLYVKLEIIEDSWFLELKKFLTELSLSRVSLRIIFRKKFSISIEKIPCFPMPLGEELAICVPPCSDTSLLHGLLLSCCPSFISSAFMTNYRFAQLIYEQLIQNDNKELFCTYNLEKVNLELFEENLKEWQTTPENS